MPCPHNEITIVQRSQRQSAVAAAAYQSGEELFCEYDQQVKHYPEKRGIVHNEILLPANAPQKYADRNTPVSYTHLDVYKRQHFIRTDLLTAGVLSNLRKVTSYAAKHEARFMKLLIEQNEDCLLYTSRCV